MLELMFKVVFEIALPTLNFKENQPTVNPGVEESKARHANQ